jgi:hypothetical protein
MQPPVQPSPPYYTFPLYLISAFASSSTLTTLDLQGGIDLSALAYCTQCAVINQTLDGMEMRHQVDLVEQTSLAEYDSNQIDSSPLIILPCKHALIVESRDGLLSIYQYYTRNSDGQWHSLKDINTLPTDVKSISVCPHCRAPIRNIHRYGRILNRLDLDVAQKKFTIYIIQKCKDLTDTQKTFERSRSLDTENGGW